MSNLKTKAMAKKKTGGMANPNPKVSKPKGSYAKGGESKAQRRMTDSKMEMRRGGKKSSKKK